MSEIISKAQIFCMTKHAFQQRKYSKEPYWIHPIRVAGLVMETKLFIWKESCIAAALLHDVIEDTDTTYEDLIRVFGGNIADIVQGLTNVSKIENPKATRAERKQLDADRISEQSSMVKLIKYCDRYDNLNDALDYFIRSPKEITPDMSAWFKIYLGESKNLLRSLSLPTLQTEFGYEFFAKYNLMDLIVKFEGQLK